MADTSQPVLTAADFPAFFRAIRDAEPFPWQERLVETVLTENRWPDLIDVPTGLGKTSTLDIAVFVAAATAHQPGPERLGRRRCFLVVDRRIVVDEAYEHALTISRVLQEAEKRGDAGILGRVAAGLRSYAPDARSGELLPVTRMRGGTTWAAAWLDRPDRPGIVLGTVDQVGSRLLFRGYGVSDRRRPIDAALVGTDSLVLVDEAHLATALLATVKAAQERDRLGIPVPGLSVVRLTATGAPTEHVFTLDVDAHRSHPEAWRRLTAAKRLTTRETSTKDCAKVLAQSALDQVRVLRSTGGQAPVVAVVCNTVDRARAVHGMLTKLVDPSEVETELLIGRSRPLNRQQVQDRILRRFGTQREPSDRPAILVATQTIEVGVNLDVDALVTESASWDALVQRLGRLNRLGRFSERCPGHDAAPAIVVHDAQRDDPIYGSARDSTWRELHALATRASRDGGIDVSPLGCRRLAQETFTGEEFVPHSTGVPVLLRPTLDAWVQTSPVPLDDPPVAPFLHGFDTAVAPVQVVWRSGLMSADPLDDPWEDGAELPAHQLDPLLAVFPPHRDEIVEVPYVTAYQWMNGFTPDPVADLESVPDTDGRASQSRKPFHVLVQRPRSTRGTDGDTPTAWQWIDAEQLRPGDQIIVPSERGGLDPYGWSPGDESPVPDVSEIVTFLPGSRRDARLRLDPDLPNRLGLPEPASAEAARLISDLVSDEEDETEDASGTERLSRFGADFAALLPDEPGGAWTQQTWDMLRRWLITGQLRLVDVHGPDDAWVDGGAVQPWVRLLVGPLPDQGESEQLASDDRDDEEVAASSIGTGPVTLTQHHTAVRRRAGEIAAALGLPAELRTVVEDAAGWHDLGKVEERFQIMLHAGDAVEAVVASEPLAKSGMDPADRLAWRRARISSGLPPGARHEAWSAALVEEYLAGPGAGYPGDTDLLIHLVASHHGYSRPFARLVVDTQPRPVQALIAGEKVEISSERTVSLEHPARFARLNERYGRWGLALLECIVRCADMTVSAEGS